MDNNKTSELVSILSQELKWNKARLSCFSFMILALLASRTISLYKMAVVLDSQAQQLSRYRRLKRFFSGFKIDGTVIARLIFKWFDFPGKKLYLTIDRTNWFRGKAKSMYLRWQSHMKVSLFLYFGNCYLRQGMLPLKNILR